jgi:hypothetical protein
LAGSGGLRIEGAWGEQWRSETRGCGSVVGAGRYGERRQRTFDDLGRVDAGGRSELGLIICGGLANGVLANQPGHGLALGPAGASQRTGDI